MDRLAVPILITVAVALAVENETQVEILSNPTRVNIQKPEPFPFYDYVNISNTEVENIVLDDGNNTIGGFDNENDLTDLSLFNFTTTTTNDTCVRQDYENYATAIFLNDVGPLENAKSLFNSSLESGLENKLNATSFEGLQLLNETSVDCSLFPGVLFTTRKLGFSALHSLAGSG